MLSADPTNRAAQDEYASVWTSGAQVGGMLTGAVGDSVPMVRV
jgi:hypothetical protein